MSEPVKRYSKLNVRKTYLAMKGALDEIEKTLKKRGGEDQETINENGIPLLVESLYDQLDEGKADHERALAENEAALASLKARCEGMREALVKARDAISEVLCYPALKQYIGSVVKDHLDGAEFTANFALASLPVEGTVERVEEDNPYLLHGDELERAEKAAHDRR